MHNLIALVLLLSFSVSVAAEQKPHRAKLDPKAAVLEARVNKLWEAFKQKDKASLSSLIDADFRQFEEGLTAFGDKRTEVNAVDEYDLIKYTLTDFNVKPVGTDAALVTYIADYEGKSGGQTAKAKSVFGEVWTRSGNEWKALYMQETYMK